MQKLLFLSLLITSVIIDSCSSKNANTASNESSTSAENKELASDTDNKGLSEGSYDASGTISFTADGLSYTCAVSKVITAPSSITIQTSQDNIRSTGSITITCYTAASAVTTSTYTSSSTEAISSVTFIDKSVMPYSATSATSGSICSVNITGLTASSVQGTFTATVLKPLAKSGISITDGVINCTISSN